METRTQLRTPARAAPSAIRARSLSKGFRLPHERRTTLREHVLHPFSRPGDDLLPALEDVSVEVAQGEFLGVVGRNGSGKSTLLRCMAGIYRPDSGSVAVEGRVASFIELGAGFHSELTARHNAVVNAILLGLAPREARRRVDAMIEFAELEDFADAKLKNLSSGMVVRLAFSVAVQVDADVLLFDEVLAVGDSSFKEKCHAHFDRLKAEGRTIVLVTHQMDAVARFCDRAILLHQGRLVEMGEPENVAQRYEELNASGRLQARVAAPSASDPGSGEPIPPRRIRSARRLARLTWTLAVAEFRVRYLDSVLSYLWTVLRPLTFFAVLYVVFTQVAQFDRGVERYPLYLLTSVVLWTFFAEATQNALGALVRNGSLLRRVAMPHLAIPLSVVLGALFNLGMNLGAVGFFFAVAGVTPRLSWLQFPLLVALLALLTTGMAMLLSALYVRLRDVLDVWQVARQALFYGSPIFYVAALYPDAVERWLVASPLAAIFTQARHALLDPTAPSAAEALGGTVWLALPLGITLAVAALGTGVYRRLSPSLVEEL